MADEKKQLSVPDMVSCASADVAAGRWEDAIAWYKQLLPKLDAETANEASAQNGVRVRREARAAKRASDAKNAAAAVAEAAEAAKSKGADAVTASAVGADALNEKQKEADAAAEDTPELAREAYLQRRVEIVAEHRLALGYCYERVGKWREAADEYRNCLGASKGDHSNAIKLAKRLADVMHELSVLKPLDTNVLSGRSHALHAVNANEWDDARMRLNTAHKTLEAGWAIAIPILVFTLGMMMVLSCASESIHQFNARCPSLESSEVESKCLAPCERGSDSGSFDRACRLPKAQKWKLAASGLTLIVLDLAGWLWLSWGISAGKMGSDTALLVCSVFFAIGGLCGSVLTIAGSFYHDPNFEVATLYQILGVVGFVIWIVGVIGLLKFTAMCEYWRGRQLISTVRTHAQIEALFHAAQPLPVPVPPLVPPLPMPATAVVPPNAVALTATGGDGGGGGGGAVVVGGANGTTPSLMPPLPLNAVSPSAPLPSTLSSPSSVVTDADSVAVTIAAEGRNAPVPGSVPPASP